MRAYPQTTRERTLHVPIQSKFEGVASSIFFIHRDPDRPTPSDPQAVPMSGGHIESFHVVWETLPIPSR